MRIFLQYFIEAPQFSLETKTRRLFGVFDNATDLPETLQKNSAIFCFLRGFLWSKIGFVSRWG